MLCSLPSLFLFLFLLVFSSPALFPFPVLRVSLRSCDGGGQATGMLQIRLMRRVKRQVLTLIASYVEVAQEAQHVPPLMQAVLIDYPRCIPEARDSEVPPQSNRALGLAF